MTLPGPPPEDLDSEALGAINYGYTGTMVEVPGLSNVVVSVRDTTIAADDYGVVYQAMRVDIDAGATVGDELIVSSASDYPQVMQGWPGEAGFGVDGLYGTAYFLIADDLNRTDFTFVTLKVDCATLACSVLASVPFSLPGGHYTLQEVFGVLTPQALLMVTPPDQNTEGYGGSIEVFDRETGVLALTYATGMLDTTEGIHFVDGSYHPAMGRVLLIGNDDSGIGGTTAESRAYLVDFEDGLPAGLTLVASWGPPGNYDDDYPSLKHVVNMPTKWRVMRMDYNAGDSTDDPVEGYIEVWDVDTTSAALAVTIPHTPYPENSQAYVIRYTDQGEIGWRSGEHAMCGGPDASLITVYKYQYQYNEGPPETFEEQFWIEVIEVPDVAVPEPQVFDLMVGAYNWPPFQQRPVITADGTRFALMSTVPNAGGGGV